MNQNDAKGRTLTLKKTLNAPIDVVWDAWTQPEHIAGWWGPKGMEVKVVEHDFRVGGKWMYMMRMPDGSDFISEGVYSEINKPHRIATSANFRPMTEGVEMYVQLEEKGDQTEFTFSVVHATVEYCIAQEKMGFYNGWGSAFNRLENMLKNLS